MSQKLLLLLGGIVLGAAAVLALTTVLGEDLAPELRRLKQDNRKLDMEAVSLKEENGRLTAALEKQNADSAAEQARALAEITALEEKVAAIHAAGRAAAAQPAVDVDPTLPGAPTEEELKAAVRQFAATLQNLIVTGDTSGVQQLRETLGRATPEQVAQIYERFSAMTDPNGKAIIAHALAHSGIEGARDFLLKVAGDSEASFIDRRSATHGLAFTGDPTLDPALLQIARTDKDRGVRANASFGLARNGSEEGLRLYAAATDEAYEKGDPLAVAYLSGYALLGEKAATVVRERLTSPVYAERQTRLTLIGFAKSNKDRQAVDALRSITEDRDADAAVRAAATDAIEAIEKED